MRFLPRRFSLPLVLSLLWAAGWLGQTVAWAELKLPEGRKNRRNNAVILAPEAAPARVEVLRGGEVRIVLKGSSSSLGPMEFIIRDQPKHGVLGAVQMPPPLGTEGAVVYRMNPGAPGKATRDSFTYAAKVAGSGVSAPVTVSLQVRERQPALTFQFAGSARPVAIGEPAEHTLTVANSGTGEFSCELSPPAPWRVRDYKLLKLKPGEQADLPLIFDPKEPRWHSANWTLSDKLPEATAKLSAESIVPFSLQPARVALQWEAAGKRQTGRFKIRNWGHSPLALRLSSPDQRLSLPETMTVPPGEELEVTAQLPEEDRKSFTGEIVVHSTAWKQTAKAEAVLSQARVTWKDQPDAGSGRLRVDWGAAVPIGQTASRRLILTNNGGQDGLASWKVSPGFFVSLKENTLRVPAGGESAFDLNLLTDAAGPKTGELRLDFGHESLSADLRAEVAAMMAAPMAFPDAPIKPVARELPLSAVLAPPEDEDQEPLVQARQFSITPEQSREIAQMALGTSVVTRDYDPSVPTPRHVEPAGAGATWVELAWDRAQDSAVAGFVLEYLQVIYDKEKAILVNKWFPVEGDVSVTSRENGRMVVRWSKLPPEHRVALRVLAKDKMGRFSEGSLPVRLTTTALQPLVWPWVLGSVVFLWLARRWWKKRPRREPPPAWAEEGEPGEFVVTAGNVEWVPHRE